MDTYRNDTDVIEIDLKEVFGLLLHYIWLILICTLATGIVGFVLSKFVVTEIYESNTQIVILNKQDNNTITYSDMQLNTQLTKDYAQLITSRHVLEKVMETCGMTDESYAQFAERVAVENLKDTRIISITVSDTDPERARILADEICKVASERIKEVMDLEAVNVVDEANLPTSPASPNVAKWTLAGAALGAFLCIAIILIRFMLDDTIKNSDDIERYLGLSTLAMIPIKEEGDKKKSGRKRKSGSESSHTEEHRHSDDMEIKDMDEEEAADAVGDAVESKGNTGAGQQNGDRNNGNNRNVSKEGKR